MIMRQAEHLTEGQEDMSESKMRRQSGKDTRDLNKYVKYNGFDLLFKNLLLKYNTHTLRNF